MDGNFGIKPRPGVTARNQSLRDPVAIREAAETETGPKSVGPASDASERNREQRPREEAFGREALIDPQNAEALLRAAEIGPGPAEASPNQALMRQRAYGSAPQARRRAEDASGPENDPHADIEA